MSSVTDKFIYVTLICPNVYNTFLGVPLRTYIFIHSFFRKHTILIRVAMEPEPILVHWARNTSHRSNVHKFTNIPLVETCRDGDSVTPSLLFRIAPYEQPNKHTLTICEDGVKLLLTQGLLLQKLKPAIALIILGFQSES